MTDYKQGAGSRTLLRSYPTHTAPLPPGRRTGAGGKSVGVRQALLVLTALSAASLAWAQPQKTVIEDILYRADGTRFEGLAFIEWKSFTTPNYTTIAEHYIRKQIVNGLIRVELVPTTNASPGAYYLVHFVSSGKIQFSETWAVPPSTTPLKLTDVRIPAPPGALVVGGATQVAISDVTGLADALSVRPLKAPGYLGGRAAVINASGELDAASGAASDCVHVDGSSGPCGTTGVVVGSTFVDGETPGGAINGTNNVFTLSQAPNPAASLLLYRNGVLQKQTLDYTLSGATVQFFPVSTPQSGDVLLASYRTGGSIATVAQVLCSGSGGSTSETILTSLATCAIPADLLQAGDRFAVEFDYAHTGSATGFTIEVRWDGVMMATQTGMPSGSLMGGRASAAVYAGTVQLSSQTWGNEAPVAAHAGTATLNPGVPAAVSFHAKMSASTTDSIALRHFTVIRYPAP